MKLCAADADHRLSSAPLAGFKQWASHMSAKLAAVQGTVEADDVKEIAKSFR